MAQCPGTSKEHIHPFVLFLTVVILIWNAAAGTAQTEVSSTQQQINVMSPNDQKVTDGSVKTFTGSVRILALFGALAPGRSTGGMVTFQPGARTAWHTHPLGQVLIVTDGEGWVQQWGQPRQMIHKGDIVQIPAGVKHWHGATATSSMTHIAIQEIVDGKNVDWLEKVDDEQYGSER